MRHPVSSTLALLLAAGLAALPASAAQAPAQPSATAGAQTQASSGSGNADSRSTMGAGDTKASAAGKGQSSGSRGGSSTQSKTEQGGSGDGMDTAGGASSDSAPEQQAADEAAASAEQRHSFSGLVLGVQPVRLNADGDARLLGRVLLDDGGMALVDFGNLEDLVRDQRSAGGRRNGPVQSGQRVAGTGTLDRQRGEPMLVVEQWQLIGHRRSAGHPPMYTQPQFPGGQGMAMNPDRPNRPGPVPHPSWVQQPDRRFGMNRGMTGGMGSGEGRMPGRHGMATAPSGAGHTADNDSMTTDMDVMLTGTVLGVGGDGDAPAEGAAQSPSQQGQSAPAGKAPRRIRVSGPEGMEVVADLGSSRVARELSLAHGDQVVLYGEAGMEDGEPMLMTHYAAKLVALPRADDAEQQVPASGPQATQSSADLAPTTAGRWPNRGTPKSVITGDES